MQDKPHISLSIAIVCFNSTELELRALIASILNSIEQLKTGFSVAAIPVYLIDNTEEESFSLEIFADYREQAAGLAVELRLLHGHGNIGYGGAHNLPLPKLETDFHLLLNPDVVLDKHCLESGITFMVDNPELVVSSPHAEYESGDRQYLCKRYPSVLTLLLRGFFPESIKKLFTRSLAAYEMRDLSEAEPSQNIPIVSGCFMLCRSDALKQAQGFDENYFLYFEDFDLSLRLGKIGKLAYIPSMRITHGGGHAARKGARHLLLFIKSGIRFFNTHGWRLFRQSSHAKATAQKVDSNN